MIRATERQTMRWTSDIDEMRCWARGFRSEGRKIALVPTMGCLHEGHLSLVDQAREHSDVVVMSVFVNPTQFGPNEDFSDYPRQLERDLDLAGKRHVDAVFCPEPEAMYPSSDTLTHVDMSRLTDLLCGASRPGHFRGVMTVVAKLFNIIEPDIAVFGQKDIQQFIIVDRMTRDLNFPVEILMGRIVREKSGLAMSSRNRYLDDRERADALQLFKSLSRARELIGEGELHSDTISTTIERMLGERHISIDYVSIVDYQTLEPVDMIAGKAIVAIAGKVGSTRLIDNMIVEFAHDGRPQFSI